MNEANNNTYETHDKFIEHLKKNKPEECKKIIKTYDRLISLYAIIAGLCCIEIISTTLGNIRLINGNLIISLLVLIIATIFVGLFLDKFIIGKNYYKYLKENNIKIIESKLKK